MSDAEKSDGRTEVQRKRQGSEKQHGVPNGASDRDRFDELLERALDEPTSERIEFIKSNCDDPDLRRELIELLAKGAQLEGFLGKPAAEVLQSGGSDQQPPESGVDRKPIDTPETIGPFNILEKLGEGGMGMVYLAEQEEPVKRKLAVKVIRTQLSAEGVRARFMAERQALARLSHPNIAQMYESGETSEGFPYFAMELIEGEPITSYCDRRQLSIEDRLSLFVRVCEGVQHAHQRGIIHRDLKPSNIMVADVEGRPVPKLIDFGIAKALDRPLTDVTQLTGLGAVGTPAYMSPESLGLDGDEVDVDTRTDVYALGVVLYELLAGVRPFDLTGASAAQIVQRMMSEDAPSLSLRLACLEDDERSDLASKRRLQAGTLQRRLAGDLDWITARATARERDRRYSSAAELAEDIGRHLRHEPVEASPPSLAYRLGKLARRHRAAVVAAVLAVLALAVGVAGLSIGMMRARQEADNAKQTVALLQEFLSSVDPGEKGRDLQVIELLEAFRPRLDEMKKPLILASLYETYARTYAGLGLYDESETCAQKSFDLRVAELGEANLESLSALYYLATATWYKGEYAKAEEFHRRCLEGKIRLLGPDHTEVFRSQSGLAIVLEELGKDAEAERIYRQCLESQRKVLGEEHNSTIKTLNNLATSMGVQGKFVEATNLHREGWQTTKRLLGEEHPTTLTLLNNYAWGLVYQRKASEAEPLFRQCLASRKRVLGEEHPETIASLNTLGHALYGQGKRSEAAEIWRQCLEVRQRVLGAQHPNTIRSLSYVAMALDDDGKHKEAEPLFRRSLAAMKSVLGDEHRSTLKIMRQLAHNLASQNQKLAEAENLARACVETAMRVLDEEHPDNHNAQTVLAIVLEKKGQSDEALTWYRQAAELGNETAKASLNRLGEEGQE